MLKIASKQTHYTSRGTLMTELMRIASVDNNGTRKKRFKRIYARVYGGFYEVTGRVRRSGKGHTCITDV